MVIHRFSSTPVCYGLISILALPGAAMASGFRVPELSAAGTGLSNAIVANTEELGALAYNPSMMSFHDGYNINAGLTYIKYEVRVDPTNGPPTESTGEDNFIVPNLFVMGQIDSSWSWGFALNSPFGLETKWPDETFLAYDLTTDAFEPEHSKIEMLNYSPNVAYKIDPNTSIGFGLQYYDLRDLALNTQGLVITGTGDDFGWVLSFAHKAGPWSFGASYKSAVEVDLSGTVDATAVGSTVSAATAVLEFPDILQVGAQYTINPDWQVEFDIERTGWSSFDTLSVQHGSPGIPNPINSVNKWDDAWAYRLGAVHKISAKTKLLLGYSLDETGQPEATFSARIPDNDRQLFSVGATHDFGDWTLQASYMHVIVDDRSVNAGSAVDGEYESDVDLLSVGVSAKF